MESKKISAKRTFLKKPFFISILVHVALLCLLVWGFWGVVERPAGIGEGSFVAVSLVSAQSHDLPHPNPPLTTGEENVAEASENSTGGSGTNSEGGNGGNSLTLQQIRSKIERVKFYPLMARRQKIEGAPVVEFKIQNNGTIEYVRLTQTSGSTLLDEAAQNTVKQAGPLPFYPQPISISLDYSLAHSDSVPR